MWTTIIDLHTGESVECIRDVWNWDYHRSPTEEKIRRDFPSLPIDYEGSCTHHVGFYYGDTFCCCQCGYSVTKEQQKRVNSNAAQTSNPA